MARQGLFAISVDESGESTRIVRWAMFVIVVLFGGMVAWGATAPISGAVVASGFAKVDTNRKSVQHFEGGIIREILVREGEMVETGQPLILLEDTDRSAEINILNDTFNAHLAKEARLMAEISQAEAVEFPAVLDEEGNENARQQMANEVALFNAKRKTLLDQIELIEDEIRHAENAVEKLKGQISAGQRSHDIVRQQLRAAEQLVKTGAIDRNSILELKRKVSEQSEGNWERQADLARAEQDVASLKLRIVNLRNDYSKNAEDELKETRQQLLETRERIRPVADSLQRKTIRAPLGGQVINLQANTVGGVVQPGEVIAEIVPAARDLVFEVRIRPSDADSVYTGQAVKVELSAFSRRSTPMIDGQLTYVSGDALVDQDGGNQELFYLAHVESPPAALEILGDKQLTPGMPVVAFVQTDPRTFFDYVISPLTGALRRSLVEDIE